MQKKNARLNIINSSMTVYFLRIFQTKDKNKKRSWKKSNLKKKERQDLECPSQNNQNSSNE